MRETLVYLTHLDYMDTEKIMTEVSLCQLQTLREIWSTSQTESAPLTSLQCAWEFSPRNGSLPCTLRPVLPGPTWLSSECQPSSPPRSTLLWSMTSMLASALQLS